MAAIIALMAGTILVPPAALNLAVLFELDGSDTFRLVLVIDVCAMNFFRLATPLVGRRHLLELQAWGRGDRSTPLDALEAAFSLPRQLSLRLAILALVTGIPPIISMTNSLLGGSVAAFVAVAIGMVGLTGAGVVLLSVSAELLLRPVREEVDAFVGLDVRPPPGRGVRVQVAAGMAAVGWAIGWTTVGLATRFHSPASIVIATGSAALVLSAFFVVVIAVPTMIIPVFRPLDDLTRGTERVALGDYTQRLPVISGDEFGELARSFNVMQAGLLERERLHAAFGSYVDPALAQRLLTQGDELFAGEEVEVTVFFADVRDFTPYAERATPRQAVERLNSLFGIVVPVLRSHHGHANKFLGDGVLAVFGVPEPAPDHADQALAAALEIHTRVQATFGDDLRIGIGINTGHVIAGTIGGGGKLEFTLIGDTVNVASRVEALTKETGDVILLTDNTRKALSRPPARLEPRGDHNLKGKRSTTAIFAIAPEPSASQRHATLPR
jgi:class 3 adenylate cyclase